MNDVGPILDAIVFALAVLLAAIAAGAAWRYGDVRFALVAGALGAIGAVGAVGAASLLWPGSLSGANLGVWPAVILIAAEGMFYLSFVVARSWASPAPAP
jgi:hypothetical protein